jgi:hypothetical protein
MKKNWIRFVLMVPAVLTGWFLRDLTIGQAAHAQRVGTTFSIPEAAGALKAWSPAGPVFGRLRRYDTDVLQHRD